MSKQTEPECAFTPATGYAFRAGDIVLHKPSGEEWQLACDEDRGEVLPCGWPACIAEAADCTLAKAATDDERTKMLSEWAGGHSRNLFDIRVVLAERQWHNNQLTDGGKTDGR